MSQARIIVGSGGVGKTTLVTCLALHTSSKGHKTLAITFDPSLRLKDLLDSETTVLHQNLEVFLINPMSVFKDLLQQINYEDKEALNNNKLFKYLLEKIVGLQEFTSLYYLNQMVQKKAYDFIYVDTPPFQNAMEFFEAPQKFKRLFQSKVLNFFIESNQEGFFGGIIRSSGRLALKTLKNLTGLDFFKQLLDFIQILEKVKPLVLKTLEESEESFKNGTILIDYISQYDEQSVKQAKAFMKELSDTKLHIKRYYLGKYPGRLDEKLFNSLPNGTLKAFLTQKATNQQETEKALIGLVEDQKLDIIKIPYFKMDESLDLIARDWNELTRDTSL